MARQAILIPLLVLLLAAVRPAHAQLPLQSQQYKYQAVNRGLVDVLRAFAADQRLNLVLDPGIPHRIVSEEVDMPPEEFLNYITGKNGLVWYFDGASLYIYRGGYPVTRPFTLRHTTPDRVIEMLKSLNAYSGNFKFRYLEPERVLLVVGPPRLIEMTAFAVDTLERNGSSANVDLGYFKLNHASASDQSYNFQGSTISIPGVATILQAVMSGQPIPGSVTTYLPRNMQGLMGQGLDRYSQSPRQAPPPFPPLTDPRQASSPLAQATQGLIPPLNGQPPVGDPANPPNGPAEHTLPPEVPIYRDYNIQPTITADVRQNAILIRDYPERMPAYQRIINALDRPSGLVEITAKIIDVTREGAFEWGLPYNTQFQRNGTPRQIQLNLSSTDSNSFAVTLLRDGALDFMHTIKLMEQEGNARVASRPSLLTMDNFEAQISNDETFFVPVEGAYEVDLFDVSVGTRLRVLPHIIEEDGKRIVKISVQVDNGNSLTETVDGIPRIRNDRVTTQALLQENESLLIGGMIREERSVQESRIPILGRLPFVGFLFRTEDHHCEKVERLVLIEPRIVAYPSLSGEEQFTTPIYDRGPSPTLPEMPPLVPPSVEMLPPPAEPDVETQGSVFYPETTTLTRAPESPVATLASEPSARSSRRTFPNAEQSAPPKGQRMSWRPSLPALR